MRDTRQMPDSWPAIIDGIRAAIACNNGGRMVIHAGHFIISAADDSACDHLCDTGPLKQGVEEYVGFTKLTWQLGCSVLKMIDCTADIQLMVLVNDWQFLVPALPDRAERERKATHLRTSYYCNTPALPRYHAEVLAAHGLQSDSILKCSSSRWLFSETALRQELARTVAGLMRDTEAEQRFGLRKYFTAQGEPVVKVEMCEGREYSLLYCGNTNCAGEIVQLLKILYEQGVRTFFNLYPIQCREPVLIGTTLAHQLFQLDSMQVVNVAIPSVTAQAPAGGPLVDRVVFSNGCEAQHDRGWPPLLSRGD